MRAFIPTIPAGLVKKILVILTSFGVLLLLVRPATISRARGCDPANGVWAGCEIALAGTDVTFLRLEIER